MTGNPVYDVAIIGGGIIGTASAMALSRRPGVSVVVIEAENKLAAHQTGNNSGVIHSGLYYKPGSLKAQNCTLGRKALYRFCEEHHIAHERSGKVVVATREEDLPVLKELHRRGKANGLDGVREIGHEELKELEPNVTGLAGLHVPETGIVDYTAVTQTYATLVKNNGGEIHLGSAFFGLGQETGNLVLETTTGEIRAKNLINCGGLQCDRIARRCGVNPHIRIVPFRGEYYELIPERQSLVRNLIYPVPDPRFPFLGVHFTRMVMGGVEAGPNAVLALKREGYKRLDMSLRDILSYLFYLGFWRMASKYGWTGLGEIWRSLSKRAFVKALRRLLPELNYADVHRGGAGVRAQALRSDGSFLDDFCIVQAPHMIHVLNAPSPAATASLSIGNTVAEMAEAAFELPS
jgi:L-2-hydroxyglutarate oxidase